MSFLRKLRSGNFAPGKAVRQALVGICLLMIFGACSSPGARDAELAAEEAARVAVEQESARMEQEQARQQMAEQQRQRELQAAATARTEAERERQLEIARAREEEALRRQEEIQSQERARLAAIAVAEALRPEKLDRITELERQIARVQIEAVNNKAVRQILREAIVVAEELLDVLTAEQAKYENTDVDGNLIEPLAKELIAELEQRKDDLLRQARTR